MKSVITSLRFLASARNIAMVEGQDGVIESGLRIAMT
jgi:hypothetical protein